jgi:PAS domain-containing protein
MAAALRKTGIDPLGDRPWGTHVCVFYEAPEDLLDTLAAYFKPGLESNEFCVWAVSEPLTVEDAQDALSRRVPGFAGHLAAGRIEILSGRDWYLEGGRFDLRRITGGWDQKLAGALASGHAGLRVSGNAFWLASEHWKDFGAYEQELETCIAGRPMIVLCTYPLAASRAADVLEVARAHQVTLARRNRVWEVVETPELKQAKEEIRSLNEKLEQRVIDRTRALAAANEQLEAEIAHRVRTEGRLRQSEAQLAEGQRLTRTGSWTWNAATRKLRWSEEHFRIFGFDPAQGEPSYEEAIGRIHPEDRPAFD